MCRSITLKLICAALLCTAAVAQDETALNRTLLDLTRAERDWNGVQMKLHLLSEQAEMLKAQIDAAQKTLREICKPRAYDEKTEQCSKAVN